MEKRHIYLIRFSGLWLGGKAVIRSIDEKAAWSALKKEWPSLEPLEKCHIEELSPGDGILYLDTGDY
jgi:hypothetical protein